MRHRESIFSVVLALALFLSPQVGRADAAALLLQSFPSAGPVCPATHPVRISHGCRSSSGTGVRCDSGYYGQFRRVFGKPLGFCVVDHNLALGNG